MKPVYGENLIVGVISDKVFNWYILEVDDCYLDYYKQAEAFGIEHKENEERGGISIVNSDSKDRFLEYVQPNIISTNQLREELKLIDDFDKRLAYQDALLINFDRKELINRYYESNAFEEIVPDGWIGKYGSYTEYISDDDKFWLDNGIELMWEGYNEKR